MDKEKFEDYKKAIELTKGKKTVVTPEVVRFFEKYFRPLQVQLFKISQKKQSTAMALTCTTILRLLDPMTDEGREFVLETVNSYSRRYKSVRKEAMVTFDLYNRLREERKQDTKESEKIGDI